MPIVLHTLLDEFINSSMISSLDSPLNILNNISLSISEIFNLNISLPRISSPIAFVSIGSKILINNPL